MVEKTFTINQVYEMMKYYVWCLEFDKDIKNCSSHAGYQDFLKEAKYHCGSCTKIAGSCSRCHLHNIEIEAQNIADCIFTTTVWCSKECLTTCNYKKGE